MSGPVAFDYQSAREIAGAVAAVKRMQGNRAQARPRIYTEGNGPMVQTPATLPGGYDGSDPLQGKLVDRIADGSILELSDVWIQSPNETALAEDTIYCGRLSGHHNESGTVLPLYWVDAGGAAAEVGLDYVFPWRWVDVDFGPPLYSGPGTQKCLLYQRNELQLFNMTSGSGYPEVADIVTPGDPYWLDPGSGPRWDITPVWVGNGEILPLYSDNNTSPGSSSSANYYDGATAAAWYMWRLGMLPRVLGRFPLSDSDTVDKHGGGTMAIQANDNQNTSGHWPYENIIVHPFLATVKYKALTIPTSVFGVTSTGFPWKNSAGTLKDLYFWFWDPMGLLANTGSDQQVIVTPVNSRKLYSGFPQYNGSGGTVGATIPSDGVMYIITAKF